MSEIQTLDFVIHFGLVTWAIQFVQWFLLNVPYVLIEKYQLFQNYKLQPNRKNSYDAVKSLFYQMIKEQFIVSLPFALVLCVVPGTKTVFSMYWESLPSIPVIIIQVILIRLIGGLTFYVLHRWLHTPWAYQAIHKVHHEYVAPFALASEYAHPFEVIVGFIVPYALGVPDSHPSDPSIKGHCGYLLPWHVDNYKIFGWLNGGSAWHDAHHYGFNYNFGERWIDVLFGTDANTYKKNKQHEKDRKIPKAFLP